MSHNIAMAGASYYLFHTLLVKNKVFLVLVLTCKELGSKHNFLPKKKLNKLKINNLFCIQQKIEFETDENAVNIEMGAKFHRIYISI